MGFASVWVCTPTHRVDEDGGKHGRKIYPGRRTVVDDQSQVAKGGVFT